MRASSTLFSFQSGGFAPRAALLAKSRFDPHPTIGG
jgi:hypothetical protein